MLKPCPFCGGRANFHENLLKIYAQCDWCLSRSDESRSMQSIREEWNTRITFDWFATLAMCQMWLNVSRLLEDPANDTHSLEDINFLEAKVGNAERLLLKSAQCISALCDGSGINDDTRRLRRELEQWLKEAMPF